MIATNAGTAQRFLDAIAVSELDARNGVRRFAATPQYVPWGKAYGGDMVAQALAAAAATVADDRRIHSTHSYFLRPVEVGEPVIYEVRITRDGRGFSARAVTGLQREEEVYAALISFAAPSLGDDYAMPLPTSARPPEELPTAEDLLRSTGELGTPAGDYWARGRSFDLRHDPDSVYKEGATEVSAQAVWIRALSEIPRDPLTRQLAIAYVCDYTILEPLLRVKRLGWLTAGLATASIDHAMWFHRSATADLNDWTLYLQQAISAQESRGLAQGHFVAAEGQLIATVLQEGVIRAPAGPMESDR